MSRLRQKAKISSLSDCVQGLKGVWLGVVKLKNWKTRKTAPVGFWLHVFSCIWVVSDGHIEVLVHPIGYIDLIADVAPHSWLNEKFPYFHGFACWWNVSHTCSTINCSIHKKPNLFARMDISLNPAPMAAVLGQNLKFGFFVDASHTVNPFTNRHY